MKPRGSIEEISGVDAQVLNDDCLRLLEAMPDAVLVVDATERIGHANLRAEELFGYERGMLLGHLVEELLPQRFRQRHARLGRKTLAPARLDPTRLEPSPTGLTLFGLRHDGSEVAIDLILTPLKIGPEPMTMVTVRDLSERRGSREWLRAREAHLEHIVTALNDVVWSISPAGDRVLFVNPAWERVFGHGLDEARSNPRLWLQCIHPEDRMRAQDSLATLLAEGHLDLEYRIVRPDGEVRWISDHAILVRDAHGHPLRIDGIARDITRRKTAEERQTELMQELQDANEELKNFAYVVSHDLKAPLRAIGSLAEWIASDNADKFDDEGREHLRLLIGRARRMDALIDGILQYSRIGRVHEDRVDIDLDRLVRNVIDSLAPHAEIRVTVDNPLPTLHAEATRLQQVFQNLIGNAVKYMDKPEGEVHIGCRDLGGAWEFCVRDNGPGIEPRHFERIFQLFQTLAPRDRVESTGIGLTVVKKIVEQHGGRIWLTSNPGEGCSFFFTLPKQGCEETTPA